MCPLFGDEAVARVRQNIRPQKTFENQYTLFFLYNINKRRDPSPLKGYLGFEFYGKIINKFDFGVPIWPELLIQLRRQKGGTFVYDVLGLRLFGIFLIAKMSFHSGLCFFDQVIFLLRSVLRAKNIIPKRRF